MMEQQQAPETFMDLQQLIERLTVLDERLGVLEQQADTMSEQLERLVVYFERLERLVDEGVSGDSPR